MGAASRILKNYDNYIIFLKFSIKNNEKIAFKHYNLVDNYRRILKEIDRNLKEELELDLIDKGVTYQSLLKPIFKDELNEYSPYINNKEKFELIYLFQLILDINNIAYERFYEDKEEGGLIWLEVVYNKLKKIKLLFLPLLKKIKEQETIH